MRTKLNHWSQGLPDFIPNSGATWIISRIGSAKSEMAGLQQEIRDLEEQLIERLSREYTDSEIRKAREAYDPRKSE